MEARGELAASMERERERENKCGCMGAGGNAGKYGGPVAMF